MVCPATYSISTAISVGIMKTKLMAQGNLVSTNALLGVAETILHLLNIKKFNYAKNPHHQTNGNDGGTHPDSLRKPQNKQCRFSYFTFVFPQKRLGKKLI